MKNNQKWKFILPLLLIALVAVGCSKKSLYMEHIHGLGYSGDGKQIIIPAHTGLVAYSEGKWTAVDSPRIDYMGFTTVDNGFYSSGHPGDGSTLKNPIGLVKSGNLGKSLSKLDFEGLNDFHNMAVAYKSHAIYVFNEQPNAKLTSIGLYDSKDDAKTWNKAEMNGFSEEPLAMAVHPTDDKVIAIGTKSGLYLSNDSGNHFEKSLPELYITAMYFNSSGNLVVSAAKSSSMLEVNLDTKEKKDIKLPILDSDDAVSYIAQNPVDPKEIVITTFKKDIYLNKDSNSNWTKIADKGNGISLK